MSAEWKVVLIQISNWVPILFICMLTELPPQNGLISRICLSWKVTIVLRWKRYFMLVLLPVCVIDLNATLMVALPGITLLLIPLLLTCWCWGTVASVLAKHLLVTCDKFPRWQELLSFSNVSKSWVQDTTIEVWLGRRGFLGWGRRGREWALSKGVKTGCLFLPQLLLKSVLHWILQQEWDPAILLL